MRSSSRSPSPRWRSRSSSPTATPPGRSTRSRRAHGSSRRAGCSRSRAAPLPLTWRQCRARDRRLGGPGCGGRRRPVPRGRARLPGSVGAHPDAWCDRAHRGRDRALSPGFLLRSAPMRFLGRISYALYLWHWPLLVLPAIALGGDLAPATTVALVALSIAVATVSTFLVEEPIRRGSGHATGRRQAMVVGGLGMALLLSVGVGVGTIGYVTDAAIAESQRVATAGPDDGATDPADPSEAASDPEPEDALIEMGDEIPDGGSEVIGVESLPTTPPADEGVTQTVEPNPTRTPSHPRADAPRVARPSPHQRSSRARDRKPPRPPGRGAGRARPRRPRRVRSVSHRPNASLRSSACPGTSSRPSSMLRRMRSCSGRTDASTPRKPSCRASADRDRPRLARRSRSSAIPMRRIGTRPCARSPMTRAGGSRRS